LIRAQRVPATKGHSPLPGRRYAGSHALLDQLALEFRYLRQHAVYPACRPASACAQREFEKVAAAR
jgi:hypothetical protein